MTIPRTYPEMINDLTVRNIVWNLHYLACGGYEMAIQCSEGAADPPRLTHADAQQQADKYCMLILNITNPVRRLRLIKAAVAEWQAMFPDDLMPERGAHGDDA